MRAHGEQDDRPEAGEPMDVTFEERTIRIAPDFSHIWDHGGRGRDSDALSILHATEAYFETLAAGNDLPGIEEGLLALLRDERPAVLFRCALRLAAKHPDNIGVKLADILSSPPVLSHSDTQALAGSALSVVFPLLGPERRAQIERTILSLPNTYDDDTRSFGERKRDELLGCLPRESLATSEAISRVEELEAQGGGPVLPEDRSPISVWSGTYSDEDLLGDLGVPLEEPPNRAILELERPVKDFGSRFGNAAPNDVDITEAFSHLSALAEALRTADDDGVHEEQANHAWAVLASAAGAIAKMDGLDCTTGAGLLVRESLLRASENPVPTPRPGADERFTRAVWSSPLARIEAAQGLGNLVYHASCGDDVTIDALRRLSQDHAPEVRYQIAVRLPRLFERDADLMWGLVEQMAEDPSPGVMQAVVSSLHQLRWVDSQRVGDLAIRIYSDSRRDPDAIEVRKDCLGILVDPLYVSGRHLAAAELLLGIPDDVANSLDLLGDIVWGFREILVLGPVAPADAEKDLARKRAMQLFTSCTVAAASEFERRLTSSGGESSGEGDSEQRPEGMEALAHALDTAGFNLALVSGAQQKEDVDPPSRPIRARLFGEARPVLDKLAEVGLPSLTYNLCETLEMLVPADPLAVFMLIADVITGGNKEGSDSGPVS